MGSIAQVMTPTVIEWNLKMFMLLVFRWLSNIDLVYLLKSHFCKRYEVDLFFAKIWSRQDRTRDPEIFTNIDFSAAFEHLFSIFA